MSETTRRSAALIVFGLAVACGKPAEPPGAEGSATFTKASMPGSTITGDNRPLSADLAVEPVSMLVMFNRLKTADKLQEALNKTPGQFSKLDLDKDNVPDPLTVAEKETKDGHAFEIRVKPSTGEFVVATMVFDHEWAFLGHYDGVMGGAASTVGRPLPATPLPNSAPPVAGAPPTATPVATDPAAAGTAPTSPEAAAGAPPAGTQPVTAAGTQPAAPAAP